VGSVSQIAYEASIRELASQEGQLAALHTRASFLLAAAGIATGTVLGRSAGTINAAGLAAVIAFGVTAIAATWILAPRHEAWHFTPSAQLILKTAEKRLDGEATLQWLAGAQHDAYLENKAKLKHLYRLLTGGCWALVAAICLSVVSLRV